MHALNEDKRHICSQAHATAKKSRRKILAVKALRKKKNARPREVSERTKTAAIENSAEKQKSSAKKEGRIFASLANFCSPI